MKRNVMSAAGAIALASVASPIQAQAQDHNHASSEIRIGLIDIQAKELTFRDKATTIDYRAYAEEGKFSANWQTESGHDHGVMMASAIVRQMRSIDRDAPIRIYAANVFQENSGAVGSAMYSRNREGGSKRTVSINWEGAKEALKWFKENDVKVVVTAFNGNDSQVMRDFMAESRKLGMVVFASAGNKVGGPAYPAKYPDAISVAGDNSDLAFAKDPSISSWVNFTMSGSVPLSLKGREEDAGSSFASAKAGAMGAYYAHHNPEAGQQEIRSALQSIATKTQYEVAGYPVSAMHMQDEKSAMDIKSVAAARPREETKPVLAANMAAAAAQGAMAR